MKHDGRLSRGLSFYYQSGTHLKQFMETVSGISQLLGNLCHNSVWSYAILWKLQETTQMLLACDDVYVSATNSHVTMEYAPCTGYHFSDPVVTTFGCETDTLTGDISGCSIEEVISNISRHCHFLGVGIVGLTASSEKHMWISLWVLNSMWSLLEYPEELQLQAAAGIKTILLIPVLPLGVVQLGSFYELSEDLKMVAQIKDFILTYQHALELQYTPDLETDNGTALGKPMIQKYSACLATAAELTDPPNFKTVSILDYDEVEFLPRLMVQHYDDPLPQDGLVGTDSSGEIIWDAMCDELLSDRCSIEQVMIDASSANAVSDQSILSYCGDDNEFSYNEGICMGFGEVEFDGIFLNYPGESTRSSSPFDFQEANNELANSSSIFQVEVPESVLEPAAAIMKDDGADYLMGSEVSIAGTYRTTPSPISDIEGFTTNDYINIPPSNKDQLDMEQELHEGSRKKGKKRGCCRPRPRDRQLIQDRVAELRELIPNGSKCSVDLLLERAVEHMMFLERVPAHAEKLNKSNITKAVKDEKSLPQNESNLPLIIENLEQPDQMLIEMQCRDYGLFLDTAQAFKRLNLTILEGALQSRSRAQLWAHFIIQVPEGFNRMDILWPLMRLLQLDF